MATFGQGINVNLGAVDYSPILKGSMAGAAMAAQGSAAIGQGLANLGQEVGKGMQIYYKKKEENKLMDDSINTLQNLNTKSPELFVNVIKDPSNRADWRALIKTAGGPAQVMQMASTLNAGIDERGGQALADLYSSQGTAEISPEDGGTYSAKARILGRNQFMKEQTDAATLANTQAETDLRLANAGKARAPVLPPPKEGMRYKPDGTQEVIPGSDLERQIERDAEKDAREERILTNQDVAAAQVLEDKKQAAQDKSEVKATARYKQGVNNRTTKNNIEAYIADLENAYARVTDDGAGGQLAGTMPAKFAANLASGVIGGLFGETAGSYISSSADLELLYNKIKGQQVLQTLSAFRQNSPNAGNIFSGSQSDAEGKLLQDSGGSLKTDSNPAMQAKILKDMITRARTSFLLPLQQEELKMQAEDDAAELGNIYNINFNLRK